MNLTTLSKQIETISALYASKNSFDRTDDWYILKLTEELGELTQAYLNLSGQSRHREDTSESHRIKFEDELADVLGHVLLLAKHHDVDLESVIERKWLKWLPNN